MGWNDVLNSGGGNKIDFTKFPEGITILRLVDSEPISRWVHWLPKYSRSVTCVGRGCPICNIRKNQKANGDKPIYGMSQRFAMHVINRSTGKLEIMEQSKTFFEELVELMKENGDLTQFDLKIRRRGTGTSTSYRIDIDETYPLTEEDQSLMQERKDLEEYFKAPTVDQVTRIVNGDDWAEIFAAESDEGADIH